MTPTIKTKKNRRIFHNRTAKNAYHNFQRDVPILESIFKKHPHLFVSFHEYKKDGFDDMNKLLRTNQLLVGTDDKSPTEIPTHRALVRKVYAALSGEAPVYQKLLYLANAIQNLFSLFELYKPHQRHPLPVLYRGTNVPILQGKTVSIPMFQSCSKLYDVAILFQGCSLQGPCCLYVLHVDPKVQYIPLYYSLNGTTISETYTMSEHEILLEPFVEYKLRKTYKKDFSLSKLKHCPYDSAPSTVTLDVYEVDVFPPPEGARSAFHSFFRRILKGRGAMNRVLSALDTAYAIKY